MKMSVSKKYLFMILLIVILLKPCSCYAANEDYVFNYEKFLFDKLCTAFPGSGTTGCMVTCEDGSIGSYDGVNTNGCSSGSPVKTFYPRADAGQILDSVVALQVFLKNVACKSGESCYEYVSTSYCNNFTSEESVCKKLSETDGKSINTTERDGSTTKICKPAFVALTNKELLNSDDKYSIVVEFVTNSSGGKSLSLSVDDRFNNIGYDSTTHAATANGNTFYFYPKGSVYPKFEKEYIQKFKDDKCPDITFCLNSLEKKDWYAEMSGKCDATKYESGISQNSNGSSETKLKLRETEPTPGKDLINGEILIGGCKALLGGDDGDSTLVDLLKTILTVVKIVVPIILIVMGSLDFARAIFSANEDEIKKSQSKFIKRLIVGVIIFLAPSILQEILTLAHSVWDVIDPTLCGILD